MASSTLEFTPGRTRSRTRFQVSAPFPTFAVCTEGLMSTAIGRPLGLPLHRPKRRNPPYCSPTLMATHIAITCFLVPARGGLQSGT